MGWRGFQILAKRSLFRWVLIVQMGYTHLLPDAWGRDFIEPCSGSTLGQALQLRSGDYEDVAHRQQRLYPDTAHRHARWRLCWLAGFVSCAATEGRMWYLALVLLVGGEVVRIIVRGTPFPIWKGSMAFGNCPTAGMATRPTDAGDWVYVAGAGDCSRGLFLRQHISSFSLWPHVEIDPRKR